MRRTYGLTLLLLCACFNPVDVDIDDSESEDGGLDDDSGALDEHESVCGNRLVEPGEACDDGGPSKTCNDDCTEVQCGDGILNVVAGEVCDQGERLGGATCEQFGYLGGELQCGTDCRTYDERDCFGKDAPVLTWTPKPIGQFVFDWEPVANASFYRLEQRPAPGQPFVPVGESITASSVSVEVALHRQSNVSYRLQACIGGACVASTPVPVVGSLAEAVGYFKASNSGESDYFGNSVAISGDGNTLAVGAILEDSDAMDSGAVYVYRKSNTGWVEEATLKAFNAEAGSRFGQSVAMSHDGNTLVVGAYLKDNGETFFDAGAVHVFTKDDTGWVEEATLNAFNGSSNSSEYFGRSVSVSSDGNTLVVGSDGEDSFSGAVYVFTKEGTDWDQEAYLKASNRGDNDRFGYSVAMSSDGNTLAVGADSEDGEGDNISNSGAVYVFTKEGTDWVEEAYFKASNAGEDDRFGYSVAMRGDGNTLAVGAYRQDSDADDSGAVYVFTKDDTGWEEEAYLKASNAGEDDHFGYNVAMSGDGNTLAVGAYAEDSDARGVNGNQASNAIIDSGAVYVYTREETSWEQGAYLKASNPSQDDYFGWSVAISADGDTLAIGAYEEDSNARGVNGDTENDDAPQAGAVYVY